MDTFKGRILGLRKIRFKARKTEKNLAIFMIPPFHGKEVLFLANYNWHFKSKLS